jgi:aspartate kinase
MEKARIGKPILVQKYGGSSVATPELIRSVSRRIVKNYRAGSAVAVIVSAMGKTTDGLIELSRKISMRPEPREMDMLLHAGEIISSALLAMAVAEEGVPSISFTGFQAGMVTDGLHTQARVLEVQGDRILGELARGKVVVVAGFQGITEEREITTLGRGGSDTSAIAIAAGIGADRCEILTDVDGVYTADPRVIPGARKMSWCSYDELLELAVLGAKVMHSRSVEIARRFGIPFQVCTSYSETPGTWITSPEVAKEEFGIMESVSIRGIASSQKVAKVSIIGVPDQPGVAARLFGTIGRAGINILLIVQAQSHEGTNDITFMVPQESVPYLTPLLDEAVSLVGGRQALVDEEIGTVSVVGEGVHREPGIAARAFAALAAQGINIDLISTSNLMITCVVPRDRVDDGVRALHDTFFPATT